MTLETRTARGIALSYGAYVADKLAMFMSTVVLAHVLEPDTFGIFASLMLFVVFLDTFRDFGLIDALVYFDDTDGLAADTTFWFGFKDDVVVRVQPQDKGCRVDVRSLSRVGGGDIGANAARVRKYLAALKAES